MANEAYQNVLDYYRQILADEPWLETSICWTVVESRTASSIEAVAQKVAGRTRLELREPVMIDAIPRGADPVTSISISNRLAQLFEYSGFLGSLPQVLERLSADGRVCSIYWDVDGNNRLSYAVNGRVLVAVDAMEPEESVVDQYPALAAELQTLAEAVAADEEDWQAAAMAVVEIVTGIRLTREWLGEPHTYVTIRWPLAEEVRPAPASLPDSDTALRTAFSSSSAQTQIDVLVRLSDRLIREFELAAFPVSSQARADLATGRYANADRVRQLREQLMVPLSQAREGHEEIEHLEQDPRWRRYQAGNALQIAVQGPGTRTRGFDTFHHAKLAFGDEWSTVRFELLDML
ncbi:DUF6461 domain-containing protein [Sphaerisporangium viridialbum]|uniref:DUF6461 domain-containing protein n=1 Tax=Sphaerisporangium viridialbum TaxID=46189 RepID=UPI003C709279